MNTKLKCILLDDELPGLAYLKLMCSGFEEVEVVKAYLSPEQFIGDLPKLDFDLCILDINMPGLNGLKIAEQLKGKPVIFTTGYKDYAVDAFNLDAVDYIVKPIRQDRLKRAIQKAVWRCKETELENDRMQINTDKGRMILYFNRICFIATSDTDSRDKVATLSDGSQVTLKNISYEKLLHELPYRQFIRINKSEVLSIACIVSYSYDEIITNLKDQSGKPRRFTLSELFRSGFLSRFKK